MFKYKDMPPGILIFLLFFVIFEIYYFFVDFLFIGLYPFHGYTLGSLSNIVYLLLLLLFFGFFIWILSIILKGFIIRDEWARKFTIAFCSLVSFLPIWAMLIGNRVVENFVFFVIYIAIIIYLMSSYVKEYFEKIEVFTYGPYTLYTKKVHLIHVDRIIDIYFFSKHTPKSGTPCAMPEGYEVGVNERTGMPYLQKIGKVKNFTYGDYKLYTRTIQLKNVDKKVDIYFFSTHTPKSGKQCPKPDGYEVGINPRTKMPYLKKKGKKPVKKVETPESKGELIYKKPSNVIYVVNKPQPGQVKGDWAVRGHGKIYSHHRTQENAINQARKIAKQRDATVLIQGVDGKFREGFKSRSKSLKK